MCCLLPRYDEKYLLPFFITCIFIQLKCVCKINVLSLRDSLLSVDSRNPRLSATRRRQVHRGFRPRARVRSHHVVFTVA
jgi:hypothetical protein